jgi:hypothetical protein
MSAITFVQTLGTKIQEDVVSYFTKLADAFWTLVVALARFLYYALLGTVVVVIIPVYGIFILALYLWGEMKLGETLSLRLKIAFWATVIPLALLQWYFSMVIATNYFG